MSPGTAVFFQLFIGGMICFIVGLLLVVCSFIFFSLFYKTYRYKSLIASFLTPFIFFVVFYMLILPFAFITRAIRGTDVGFGDVWHMPIKQNFTLTMINSPENATIKNPAICIKNIQYAGDYNEYIYGVTTSHEYFLINTTNNHVEKSLNDLFIIKTIGKEHYHVVPVREYYYNIKDLKWGYQDKLFMIFIIIISILSVSLLWYTVVFKSNRFS